jgi:hypothetical protein
MRSAIARYLRKFLSLAFADVLCGLLLVIGLCAWSDGILHRVIDYDELEHFHASWLVSLGLKPFYQFWECHPPFAWYPLSLFFRVFGDSYNLVFVFRYLAALGQVVFIVGVLKNVALSLRELSPSVRLPARVAALAAMFIAFHPAMFDYLIEFRIDSWPNAILVVGIYRYRVRRTDVWRSSIELAALSMLAVLCSPKLVIFAGMFAGASVVVDARRPARALGMLAGGVGMLLLGAGLLKLAGLNPIHVYRLSLGYHKLLNAKGGFGHGVYDIVWGQKMLRNVVIASAIAWPLVARRRIHREGFEIAALVFLVLQLKLVTFGYKQYYVPWYLLAIVFLPYLEVLFRRVRLLHALLLSAAVVYVGDNVLTVYREYQDSHALVEDLEARKALEALVPPGSFVMASIETMPLFRRDSVYQYHTSYAPSGFDGTRVMQELQVQPFAAEFTTEKARAELEARPPYLIMNAARYPPYVRLALDGYIAKHDSEYRHEDGHFGPYLVRRSPAVLAPPGPEPRRRAILPPK